MRIVKQPPLRHRDISVSGRGLRPIVRRIARHNRLYDDIRERYRQRLDDDYEPATLTFRDERTEGEAELLGGVYTLNIMNRFVTSTALTVTNQAIFERLAETFRVFAEAAGVYLPAEQERLERCYDRVVEREHLLELADALAHLSGSENPASDAADGRISAEGGATAEASAVSLGARDLSRLVALMVSDGQLRQIAEESGVLGELQALLGAVEGERAAADEADAGVAPMPARETDRPNDGATAFLQWLVKDAAGRLAAAEASVETLDEGDSEGARLLDTALSEALTDALQLADGEESVARKAAGEDAEAPARLETAQLVMVHTDRELRETLQREVIDQVRMLRASEDASERAMPSAADGSSAESAAPAAAGECVASDARFSTMPLSASELRERIIELVGDIDAAEVASLHERGILPAADSKAVAAAIKNMDDEAALRELARQVIDVRRRDYLQALVDLYRSETSSLEAVLFSADEALFERLEHELADDTPLVHALHAVAAAADEADTAPLREAARAVLADATAGERVQTRTDMTRLVSSLSTVLDGTLDVRLEHLVRSDTARTLVTQLHAAIDRAIADGGVSTGATLNGQVLPFLEVLCEAQQGFDDMARQMRGAGSGDEPPMGDVARTTAYVPGRGMDAAAADYLARNRATLERTGLSLPGVALAHREDQQAPTMHEARDRIVTYLQTLEAPEFDRLVDAGVLPVDDRTELVEQIMSLDSAVELRVLGARVVAAREADLEQEAAALYRAQAAELAQVLGAGDTQQTDAALVALTGDESFDEAVRDIVRIMDADGLVGDFAPSVELVFDTAATVAPAERRRAAEQLVRMLVTSLGEADSPVAERLVRSEATQTVIEGLRDALGSTPSHGTVAADLRALDATESSGTAQIEAIRQEAQDLAALAATVGAEELLLPASERTAALDTMREDVIRSAAEIDRALAAVDIHHVDVALGELAHNREFVQDARAAVQVLNEDDHELAATVELVLSEGGSAEPDARREAVERLVHTLVDRLAARDGGPYERSFHVAATSVVERLRTALAAPAPGASDTAPATPPAASRAASGVAPDQPVQDARERIVAYLRTLDTDELDELVVAGVLPQSDQASVLAMVGAMTDEDELRAVGERIVEVRSVELVHAAAQLYRADAEELALELFAIQPQQADAVLAALDRDEAFAVAARETARMLDGTDDAAQLSASVELVLAPDATADPAERRRSVEHLVRVLGACLADADGPVAAQLVHGGAAETVLAHLQDALASAAPAGSASVGITTDAAGTPDRRALTEAVRREAQELAQLAIAVNVRDLPPVSVDTHSHEAAETVVPALSPARLIDRDRTPQGEIRTPEQQSAPVAPTVAAVTRILDRLTHVAGSESGIAAVRQAVDREAAALEGDIRQQLIVALDDTFAATGLARTSTEDAAATAQQAPTGTSVYLTLLDLIFGDESQGAASTATSARTLELTRVLTALRPQRTMRSAQAASSVRTGARQTAREQAAPYRTIEKARDELVLADAAAHAAADAPQAPIARAVRDMEHRITALANNATNVERVNREFKEQLTQSVTSLRTSLERQDAQIADLKRRGDELAAQTSREVVTGYVFREFERKAVIERMRRGQ